jgi:hypothetical protein
MDLSQDRLRNERIQSISYMVPRILVQRTAVTNRLSLAVFKEIIGDIPFGWQTRFTSNKHVVHCPSKFCWQRENTICVTLSFRPSSVREALLATHTSPYKVNIAWAHFWRICRPQPPTYHYTTHTLHYTTLHYTTRLDMLHCPAGRGIGSVKMGHVFKNGVRMSYISV